MYTEVSSASLDEAASLSYYLEICADKSIWF